MSVGHGVTDAKGRTVTARRVYQSGEVEHLLADGSTAAEPVSQPLPDPRLDRDLAHQYNNGPVAAVPWPR
jgi:hypothetical protein